MAVLSLPLSFTNSFWSQDYRRGLEVLYSKLEQGVAENDEIITFIRARARLESQISASLSNPMLTGPQGTGFGADDGASLLMAFRGLQAESADQGQVHRAIAQELQNLVADPFDEWAQRYKERLAQNKNTVVDVWLLSYEQAQEEVANLKQQYFSKTRRADEAEDDAKFAPNAPLAVTSPGLGPQKSTLTSPKRVPTVSQRIAERLKEIQLKAASTLAGEQTQQATETLFDEDEKVLSKVDKGKGKAAEGTLPPAVASPSSLSPPLPPSKLSVDVQSSIPAGPPSPILLAGLSIPPATVSALLKRAAAELPLRPVRFALLGEYPDCFTGEEFVAWLNENVQGFGGNLDKAEDAAKELTERDGLLRRIGEFGNQFDHSDEAFYQFRPKAFELDQKSAEQPVTSPVKSTISPVTDNLIKKSNAFANLVSKALAANSQSEPAYVKARHEADAADQAYRVAVRQLDRHRLGLEEKVEDTLKSLQKWEAERLRAVKTVLLQYQGTMANLPKALEPSLERSSTLIATFQPENDLTALMERYRTGPFRPDPQVYESVAHDECDVVFGVDLRKWAEGSWSAVASPEEGKKDIIPPVLTALLDGLNYAYSKLPNDTDRRMAWIYEVPLPAVHHLREALNAVPPEQPITKDVLEMYDAPVMAGAVKLWALELDPPLALYEGWEDFRKLYPTVGSAAKVDGYVSEQQRIQDLQLTLLKLPRVHLLVLDAIVKHLRTLIDSTTVKETEEIYLTKLALSVGRTIIRPKVETELSIQDRHPTLLFIDLVKNYEAIIPPTILRKKRESERKIPTRKRTAPVDMRLSRSRISGGADAKQLLAAQQAAQNPSLKSSKQGHSDSTSEVPPVPPLPKSAAVPPPPPPAAKAEAPAPAPAPAPAAVPTISKMDTSGRPMFKEPPPEEDDLPPRPTFKEPPPETPDSPPPMPAFAEPPIEGEGEVMKSTSPSVGVIPPTPQKKSPTTTRSGSQSPVKSGSGSPSRSMSPAKDSARASLTRTPSGPTAGVRGPRISKGPRPPGGSNVSSMVSNLNRQSSIQRPGSPGAPGYKRLSGSPVRTPSPARQGVEASRGKDIKRGSFSSRTMASDAEDEILRK